ncbi:hypothetical protein F2Q69_00037916 [Brassica cretica]|uniref:Uncharacterized protein n=1 Tax=Brassica cretica TaxID=69181 RepID=A0A8S9SPN1_BRACR|nr:hypothetical protein F2Q69_00037916 [Brassica cretica]
MTNDNNTPIDTTDVIQTPLNAAATDATGVTTAAATTSTILPAGNAADETERNDKTEQRLCIRKGGAGSKEQI